MLRLEGMAFLPERGTSKGQPHHWVTTGTSPEALFSRLPWLRPPWALWMGWTTSALETRCPQVNPPPSGRRGCLLDEEALARKEGEGDLGPRNSCAIHPVLSDKCP